MSGLEKATSALTIGNTVWLAILTLYQYRTNTALKTSLVDQEKILKRQAAQIRELQEAIKKMTLVGDSVKILDEDLRKLETEQKRFSDETNERLENHDQDMEALINILKENDIDVDSIMNGDFSSLQSTSSSSSKAQSSRQRTTSRKPSKESSLPSKPSSRLRRTERSSRPTTPAKTKAPPRPEPQTETEAESEFDASAFVSQVNSTRKR